VAAGRAEVVTLGPPAATAIGKLIADITPLPSTRQRAASKVPDWVGVPLRPPLGCNVSPGISSKLPTVSVLDVVATNTSNASPFRNTWQRVGGSKW